jgi:hypothetical protein
MTSLAQRNLRDDRRTIGASSATRSTDAVRLGGFGRDSIMISLVLQSLR